MAEFTPITTQEELDRIIAARLQRERETVTKQYEGRIAEFEQQIGERDQKITGFESQIAEINKQLDASREQAGRIAELEAENRAYETSSVKMRIAREVGLPYELAERLSGDEEKSIREDAEALKKIFGKGHVPPLQNTEMTGDPEQDEIKKAWNQVSQAVKGE